MLQHYIGQRVVIDLSSPYVCLGTLVATDEVFLELTDADVHDLRDTRTSRENYVVAALHTGIKHNRTKVLIARREIVAIARIADVAAE
jgi:small nuclear ribonucleoprotein (snRNP)-like protein